MMNRKKYLIASLLLIVSITGFAQTVVPSGSPNQVTDFKGGIKVAKTLSLPVTDTEPFPGQDKFGQVRISPTDSIVRYFNGTNWVKLTTEDNGYVTTAALRDSLEQVQQFAIDTDSLRVPYTGADKPVDLGDQSLTGGFLMAKKNITPPAGFISYLIRTQSSTGNFGFRVYEDENGKLHVTDSGGGDLGNVKYGPYALYNSGTGGGNTAVGYNALGNLTTGNVSTALGQNAGMNISSGSFNTFLGRRSGFGFTDGGRNLFITSGQDEATGLTTGNGNVIIGRAMGLPSSMNNMIWMGDGFGNPMIVKSGGSVNITGTSLTFNGTQVGLVGYESVKSVKTDVSISSGLTGTTGETILKSYEIPAGTLSAGYMDIDLTLSKTGNASTVVWKVYKNTSNSLSGAAQIATYTMPGSVLCAFFHREFVLRGTGIYGYNFGGGALSDDTATSSLPIQGTNFNTADTQHIIITAQLSDASDTAYVYATKIMFANSN